MFASSTSYESNNLTYTKDRIGFPPLCEIGWITPETLQRRRSSPALDDLKDFLSEHSLGLIITVPRGSPSPELLLAFGRKTNEAPYTYPEVERLMNLAELMDNILIRARLNAQADLQAQMEHLTMMSRGLAHDLKNLVTPFSAFLIHTDGEYAPGSAEAEVHLAARRALRVIGEYIREAMFFAEKMRPRFESVEIPSLLAGVRSIVAARAQSRGVSIQITCSVSLPIIADAVMLQRLLANLVHNAIDASQAGKCVRLGASLLSEEQLRLEVSDHGTGISPENLNRVFEPHFTTKVFGDDVRGFGLGLTICQTITDLHGGKIDLQSEKGVGTTVTVLLPTVQETIDTPESGLPPSPLPVLSAAGT